jgi:hypothetical protein
MDREFALRVADKYFPCIRLGIMDDALTTIFTTFTGSDIATKSTIATQRRVILPDYWQWNVAKFLYKYVSIGLIVVGTVFNGMTIAVLARGKFGKTSTRILLITLALGDTCVLWTGMLQGWFTFYFGVVLATMSLTACKIMAFMGNFSLHFSVWNLSLVTVERLISVCFPMKARIICTARNTTISLAVLFIIILGLNTHYLLWEIGPGGRCEPVDQNYFTFFVGIWYWFDLMLRSGGPVFVIMCCNAVIIGKLIMSQIERKRQLSEGSGGGKADKQLTSMTSMLVTISIAFIILTLPSAIFFLVEGGKTYYSVKDIAILYLKYTSTSILTYSNSAINFFLYCLSGSQFRSAVFSMYKECFFCRRT